MSTRKLHFDFNSAITGVSETDGKWNENNHRSLVLPLRGRLMQCDGICGIEIGRYYINVEFLDTVTTAEKAEVAVHECITWALTTPGIEGLFPLRGDKTPTATLERPTPPRASHRKQVIASFSSYIVTYPTKGSGDYDNEAFGKLVSGVAAMLADTDGVTDCKVALTGARLDFDTRITTAEAIQNHMEEVLRSARGTGNIFPYADDNFECTFSVSDC